MSNDTGSITLIADTSKNSNAMNIVSYGLRLVQGEHRKIGDAPFRVITQAHILTRNDELRFKDFAETNFLTEKDEDIAEKYVVRSRTGIASNSKLINHQNRFFL